MSCNWPEVFIETLKADSKNAIAMGPFGSRIKVENFVETGIPVIKGGNLTGDFIVEDKFDFLTKVKADELQASNAFRRDIVITHRGTIGQVGIIPDNSKYERYVVSQSQLKITLNGKKVNPFFVYYFLRSPIGQHRLLLNASQVGVPAIARASSSVKKILMPLPKREIQDEIVEMMLAIDDKIELNRQINQTLEQIAQAMFKSWFVDFEPVKAKIEARAQGRNPEQTAMSAISGKTDTEIDQLPQEQHEQLAATAALFPDEMVDSELGLIPKGWEVKSLSHMIELIGGGTPKRSKQEYWGGDIPWFSVKDSPVEGDVYVIDTEEKITEIGLNNSSTKLLPEGVTIISARGTVGRLALVGCEMAMNQSCYGVKGKDEIGPVFNYFNLKQAISTLKRQVHGAVFDTITTKTFETVITVRPCRDSVQRFEEFTVALFRVIKNNLVEINSLVDCRDLILPKLLSGEITVGDTQIEIKGAV